MRLLLFVTSWTVLLLGCGVEGATPAAYATLWPRNIYYNFTAAFTPTMRSYIKRRLDEFAAKTCLNIEENNEGKARLHFVTGGGCGAGGLGMGKGHLEVSLDPDCYRATQHEFMHVLGFDHTQMRSDRDQYITVNWDKLKGGQKNSEFEIYSDDEMRQDLNVSYDYASLVHYPATSSSIKKGDITMSSPGYENTMAMSHEPPFSDLKQINTMYECGDHCPPIKCENGGYPHPRTCGKCVCHDFSAGDRCQILQVLKMKERPGDVEDKWESDNGDLHNGEKFDYYDFSTYNKMIPLAFMAPLGKKLLVKITEFDLSEKDLKEVCAEACWLASLEFVDNPRGDLTMGGKRYCCEGKKSWSFVSETNVIGFRGHVRKGWKYNMHFTVEVHEPRGNQTWQPDPVWSLPYIDGKPVKIDQE